MFLKGLEMQHWAEMLIVLYFWYNLFLFCQEMADFMQNLPDFNFKSVFHRINDTKSALFFLSRTPTHSNFIFDLLFLYELKGKVRFSDTVCRIFQFDSISFLLKFILLFKKMHGLFEFKAS